MKLIGITQSVIIIPERCERRDALDQRWASFLHACGYTPYSIPNNINLKHNILSLPLCGLILTGGNKLKADVPERDLVETALLEHALSHRLPVLGVCRGMQLILSYFGSSLVKIKGHVKTRHTVFIEGAAAQVNSYHDFGVYEVQKPLEIIGKADDGVVEAVKHSRLPLKGMMWHPERNDPFVPSDIKVVNELFNS